MAIRGHEQNPRSRASWAACSGNDRVNKTWGRYTCSAFGGVVGDLLIAVEGL